MLSIFVVDEMYEARQLYWCTSQIWAFVKDSWIRFKFWIRFYIGVFETGKAKQLWLSKINWQYAMV